MFRAVVNIKCAEQNNNALQLFNNTLQLFGGSRQTVEEAVEDGEISKAIWGEDFVSFGVEEV